MSLQEGSLATRVSKTESRSRGLHSEERLRPTQDKRFEEPLMLESTHPVLGVKGSFRHMLRVLCGDALRLPLAHALPRGLSKLPLLHRVGAETPDVRGPSPAVSILLSSNGEALHETAPKLAVSSQATTAGYGYLSLLLNASIFLHGM